jgi:hypothetical protein
MKIMRFTHLTIVVAAAVFFAAAHTAHARYRVGTFAADEITAESAQLNGFVNPSRRSTRYAFEMRRIGQRHYHRVTSWRRLPRGSTNIPVARIVANLRPETTYRFRVVAIRAGVRKHGSGRTFTTLPVPPTAVTGPAQNVLNSTATLTGTVTKNASEDAVAYFEWGTTTNYGNTTATFLVNLDTQNVSSDISGLAADTTYHFRLVATNSGGIGYGEDQTFSTTVSAPSVTTLAATIIDTDSAILNGSVNPNGGATTVFFEWGTSTAYGNVTAATSLPAGASPVSVSATLDGLAANTTYHFRVVATNSGGRSEGADVTFTITVNAPIVTTTAATAVNATTATLNGTVNPNGVPATARFEWGTTISYGNLTDVIAIPAGNSPVSVSATLNGLTPNTTYHFRLIAMNAGGSSTGGDVTFFTQPVVAECTEAALRAAMAFGGTVLIQCDSTITLANTIEVSQSVTLDGTGHTVTISGGGSTRVFTVNAGVNFTLNNLTIANGSATRGGGLLNNGGSIQLSNVTFRNNHATEAGGALANESGSVTALDCDFKGNAVSGGSDAKGGAIANAGTLLLANCSVADNSASATSTLEFSAGAFGGGLYNEGTATLSNCVVSENVAAGGAAIANDVFVLGGGVGEGGGIHNAGTLTVATSRVDSNIASGGAGTTLTHDPGVSEGANGTAGGTASGGGISHRDGTLQISQATIQNNLSLGGTGGAGGTGGTAPVGETAKTGGTGGAGGDARGGAVFLAAPSAGINASLLAHNSVLAGSGGAGGTGGGISGVFGGKGGTGGIGGFAGGGAVHDEAGALNVTNSTMAGNTIFGGNGGAAGSGAPCNPSLNSPGAGGNGGSAGSSLGAAVYSGFGTMTIIHGTIASNAAAAGVAAPGAPGISACSGQPDSAAGAAGASGTANAAIFTSPGRQTILVATIVAYNQVPSQIVGPLTDTGFGYNIFSDASGAADSTSLLNTDPLLGPLSDNGGPTLTMPLLPGSPAIDTIPPEAAIFSPSSDQRGVARPQGTNFDVGAFEKN